MTPSPVALTIGLLMAVLADASPAGAQSGLRPYAGGSVGNFSVSADEAEAVRPRAVSSPASRWRSTSTSSSTSSSSHSFTRTYTGASVSFALQARRRRARPAERDHAIRQGARSQREHLRRRDHSPDGGTTPHARPDRRADKSARARPDGLHADLDPGGHRPAHPAVVGRTESSARNIGGPTIGGQLAIAVTPRLSIVPDVRYDYGSIGDEINNTLRVSARVQWRF